MNVKFDKLTAVKAVKQSAVTTTQTIHVNCNEDVESILLCTIDSNVFSYECLTNQVSFVGKNNVKLVYRDNEGQLLSSSSSIDYTNAITSNEITAGCKVQFDVVVVDYKTTITGNIVTVDLTLDIVVTLLCMGETEHLAHDEQLFIRENAVEIADNANVEMIDCSLSCQLQATKPIDRVIMADARINATDYNVNDDVLTVSGDILVGLLYESNGEIVCDQLKGDYRNEMPYGGGNGHVVVTPLVKTTRIKLDMLEEQLNDIFTIDINAVMRTVTVATTSYQLIDDCYAGDYDLTLEKGDITTTLPCGAVSARKTIQQTIEGINATEAVAYACTTSEVSNVKYLDGAVVVEGLICGTLLFKQNDVVTSKVVELPFVESVDIEYIDENCHGEAIVTVINAQTAVDGENITVTVNMQLDINSKHDVTYRVIKGVTASEIDTTKRSAIEVSVARQGETLWQLAKTLHMPEQAILDINPEITSPLSCDTKIVIYNKL